MRKIHALCIVLIVFALLLMSGCQPGATAEEKYKWKTYTEDELLSLFEENKDLFQELAQVIADAEDFHEKGHYEYDLHSCLRSPDDERLDLFSESDRETILEFYEFGPYMIADDADGRYVEITFINSDRSGGFVFLYWIDQDAVYEYEDHIDYLKQFGFVQRLTDGWILYWYR